MEKISPIHFLKSNILLSALILTACGSAQQVGQKVEANPIINVNVPGAVAPAPAATAASSAPTKSSTLPSTSTDVNVSVDEDTAITQVLKDNVNALNAANQSAYVDTFDPSSPLVSAAPTVLQASIQFGVKQEVVSVSVSSKSTTSATVILNRRVSSPMSGTQTERVLCGLNKINNSWKISTMTIQSSDAGFM